MLLVIGLALFVLLIVAHEFGHFIVAKRNGVAVEEFGIGFPPRLLGRRFKGTLYSLNLIPLGGFVKLKGEADADTVPGSFGLASYWQKAKILLAGVGMNVVIAFVFFFIVALIGMPRLFPGQYTVPADEHRQTPEILLLDIRPDSPAAAAGLQAGDVVTRVNNTDIHSVDTLIDYTDARPEETVEVAFSRDGQSHTAPITLARTDTGEGQLGVVPFENSAIRYTWSAPLVAAGITLQTLWLTVVVFGGFIATLAGSGVNEAMQAPVTGPVGIFTVLQSLDTLGLANYLLVIVASISASLAALNALPIPALDGGRLAVISGFRLFKRKLRPNVENAIHSAGFLALIGLIIIITVIDVRRFFS